tara:strand:- start:875 stop:1018 length:144 start_codon:yes stop_codon:yes gene_type:complete
MEELKKEIARLESENAFLKEVIYTQYKKAKTAYNYVMREEEKPKKKG